MIGLRTIQCIHKWSRKEINSKMIFAAKMNFFRRVVTKTACEELQEYVAVSDHLEIGKGNKKKIKFCVRQHSIACEGKQLLLYTLNDGL